MLKSTLLERTIAEVLGSFLLVFIGCGSASVAGMLLHNGVLKGSVGTS
jgi:glycerol uptake facilitator-like aquaporin